jgi:hypothetical protein
MTRATCVITGISIPGERGLTRSHRGG